jgi:hypothetical protein
VIGAVFETKSSGPPRSRTAASSPTPGPTITVESVRGRVASNFRRRSTGSFPAGTGIRAVQYTVRACGDGRLIVSHREGRRFVDERHGSHELFLESLPRQVFQFTSQNGACDLIQSRAFLLELMIVIILPIDLAFLFRSKWGPGPRCRSPRSARHFRAIPPDNGDEVRRGRTAARMLIGSCRRG